MKRTPVLIGASVLLCCAVLAVFALAPGFIEYQQIRWRTRLPAERIEAGMSGMLAVTKALEIRLGRKPLTTEDFRSVSAEATRKLTQVSEDNDLSAIQSVLYLQKLDDDPSGAVLRTLLLEKIADECAARVKSRSETSRALKDFAVWYAPLHEDFRAILARKVGDIARLQDAPEAPARVAPQGRP